MEKALEVYAPKGELARRVVESCPVGYTGFKIGVKLAPRTWLIGYSTGIGIGYESVHQLAVESGSEERVKRVKKEDKHVPASAATMAKAYRAARYGRGGWILN